MRKFNSGLIATVFVVTLFIGAGVLTWLESPIRAQFYPVSAPDTTFSCSLVGIAATLTQCQAIPAVATQRYFITDISVQSTTATANGYNIESGTGANCVAATTAVFPKSGVADKFKGPGTGSPMAQLSFTTPLPVAAGHEICVLGVATDTTSIHISGYVK